MNEPADIANVTGALRVFIVATDMSRRSDLNQVVETAGHFVVSSAAAADVVVVDADGPSPEGKPVLALRGRQANLQQLDAALRALAAGLVVQFRDEPETGFAAMSEARAPTLLSPREVEVLNAIADGLTNKEIARRLEISLHTVKFHVEALLRKLGARNRAEAAAKAAERRRRETIEL